MELKELIKQKRPHLSDSSLVAYNSVLRNIHNKVFGTKDVQVDNFNNVDKIMDYYKDLDLISQMNAFNALFIITENKKYQNAMVTTKQQLKSKEHTQEMNEKQKESHMDNAEIKAVWEKMQRDVNIIYKKKTLSMDDYQFIQNYILLSLMGGIFIPPRRSMDWTEFKIKNIDREKDNYLDKNTMVFNTYKTAYTYGEQRVEIPKPLKSILTKWIKRNPTDYLLFDTKSNKLSSTKITQRFNVIFDGKVSTNALRHSYMSNKYQDTIQVDKELKHDFTQMGSSASMKQTYVKKIDSAV
jgi:hypothetical protein